MVESAVGWVTGTPLEVENIDGNLVILCVSESING